KRGVLSMCHDIKPTFVRAIEADRVDCYDSMPDNVELAIGWVRTSSRLAAMRKTPTAMEPADRVLADATQRPGGIGDPLRVTGHTTGAALKRTCADDTKGLTPVAGNADLLPAKGERATRGVTGTNDPAMVALGLAPRVATAAAPLPVLPLDPSGKSASPD